MDFKEILGKIDSREFKWKIDFYNDQVLRDILKWPGKMISKFERILDLVEKHGPQDIGMPHVKSMKDGLFEIRVKAQEGIGRAFFCYVLRNEVVILHGFIKKTQKTPEKDLNIARKRLKEVKNDIK